MRRLNLTLLLMFVSNTASAEWWVQAPEDSCVTLETLVVRLRESVSPDALATGPRRTLSVRLAASAIRVLVARENEVIGERVVEFPDASCDELLEGAVFVLATMIEGGVGELAPTTRSLPTDEGATLLAPPQFTAAAPEVGSGAGHALEDANVTDDANDRADADVNSDVSNDRAATDANSANNADVRGGQEDAGAMTDHPALGRPHLERRSLGSWRLGAPMAPAGPPASVLGRFCPRVLAARAGAFEPTSTIDAATLG